MALDATVAAATANLVADDWIATVPSCAPYRAAIVANYTLLFTRLFTAITANAVVSPVGVPPMSNGAGAVAGTGKVL